MTWRRREEDVIYLGYGVRRRATDSEDVRRENKAGMIQNNGSFFRLLFLLIEVPAEVICYIEADAPKENRRAELVSMQSYAQRHSLLHPGIYCSGWLVELVILLSGDLNQPRYATRLFKVPEFSVSDAWRQGDTVWGAGERVRIIADRSAKHLVLLT